MANVLKPAGLRPVQYIGGNPWSGQARTYFIPSTDTNAYAIGDPVCSAAGGSDANGVAQVVLGPNANNAFRGVIVGTGSYEYGMFFPNNLNTNVIPATKTQNYYVMVADDPDIIFAVMESGTPLTASSCNLNANLSSAANNGFISQWVINNASVAVTATLQVKLLGLQRTSDNAFGTGAQWLVKINNHEFSGGIAGI